MARGRPASLIGRAPPARAWPRRRPIIHSEPHSDPRRGVIDSWQKTAVRAGSRFRRDRVLRRMTALKLKTIGCSPYPTFIHSADTLT